MASSSDKVSAVGDVNHTKPPEAEWKLEAKGMKTDGYWASSTSHKLTVLPGDGALGWIGNETVVYYKQSGRNDLPATYEGEQYIKVSRELSGEDMPESELGHHMARVPVLEGTTVVAATLDGEQVTLYTMQDGTTGLVATSGTKNYGLLEYWLVPDAAARRPHAVEPITFNAKQQSSDFTEVPYVWDEVIPHFADKSPAEQRRLMDEYLSNEFYYTFTPDADKGAVVFKAPGQYTREVLEKEVAQCNRAATTFAIGTIAPSNSPELSVAESATAEEDYVNIVTGYHNDGDKALTDHEAHMWNVETDADRFDPTPTKRAPEADKTQEGAFSAGSPTLSESAAEDSLELIGWLLGSAAAGALLARPGSRALRKFTVNQARRARSRTENLRQKLTADPAALHQALDILDAVQHDPKRDITKAAALGNSAILSDRSAQAGLEKLMMVSHHNQDGRAQKQVKLSYFERLMLDRTTRRAVRRADGILRKGQKLYRRAGQDMGYDVQPDAQQTQ